LKKAVVATWLAIAGSLFAGHVSAGPVLLITPTSSHVDIGQVARINVSISGLDAEVLSSFDLNFIYDSSVVRLDAAELSGADGALGSAFGAPPLVFSDAAVEGNYGVLGQALTDDATLIANQQDAFLLFQFDFVGMANGLTTLSLGADADFERSFIGLNFAALQGVSIQGACVAVGTGSCSSSRDLPEPASAVLVAAAGLAACGSRLRRRQSP
jgi:hypothetical protein